VKLLYNAAWFLYEDSDYDTCVRVVQAGWLACEEKGSLQWAELCNVAAAAYLELNKLEETRKNWTTTSEIHELMLEEDDLDVGLLSNLVLVVIADLCLAFDHLSQHG
jgi:hypothetical protein